MYSEIQLKDGRKLIKKEKNGRKVKWIFNDDSIISGMELRAERVDIKCKTCSKLVDVGFYLGLLKKEYECRTCRMSGKRNPFYGKTHTEECKKKRSEYMTGRFVGEQNPFYGKTHTDEIKTILSNNTLEWHKHNENGFKGKTHTNETKSRLSEKNKEYAKNHPEELSRRAIKGLKNKKYKKTIPEKLTEQKLIDLEFDFKYNKIIKDVGQFDFIIGEDILLEVHGDYWHANPNIYGEGKKPLNNNQLYKIDRDRIKKEKAEKLGFTLYYIWEEEIHKGQYEVLNEIQTNRNRNIRTT
jgi:G:T-mismatch repair DNA endonuclease (very short patch repair protein)